MTFSKLSPNSASESKLLPQEAFTYHVPRRPIQCIETREESSGACYSHLVRAGERDGRREGAIPCDWINPVMKMQRN